MHQLKLTHIYFYLYKYIIKINLNYIVIKNKRIIFTTANPLLSITYKLVIDKILLLVQNTS